MFEIETSGGYVGFENKKGSVLMRGIKVTPLDQAATADGAGMRSNSGQGFTNPKAVHEVKPSYPPHAKRTKGLVRLEAVVLPDGTVGAVRVVASLDPDLDLAAMTATKEWLFTPGTRDGKPIPVIVRIEMSFRP